MPFYGRDPRVPRGGKYATAAGGQNCDCRRGREKGTVLRRREGAEGACTGDAPRLSRRVGKKTVTAAGGGRKEQFCGGEKERKEPAQATRRDYLDEWARYLPQRTGGRVPRRGTAGRAKHARRHSETEGIPTGRGASGGVTDQRRESAKRGGLTDGILRFAQDDNMGVAG